jgi:hypothetical protein
MARTLAHKSGFFRLALATMMATLGVWLAVFPTPESHAARAQIGDMNVTLKGDQLRIRSSYHGAFTKHVNNAMLAGIPIVVTIQTKIDCVQEKRKKIQLTESFEHSINYDTITSQYTLEVRRGAKAKTYIETMFSQVREIASTIDCTVPVPQELLERGMAPEFEVRIKATLDSQKDSFALQFILFLLRNPIDTPWRLLIFKPAIEQLGDLDGDK